MEKSEFPAKRPKNAFRASSVPVDFKELRDGRRLHVRTTSPAPPDCSPARAPTRDHAHRRGLL
jgi:hypothetical protein